MDSSRDPLPGSGAIETHHAWQRRIYELGQRERWEEILLALDHPPQQYIDSPVWQWTIRGRALEHLKRPNEALIAYKHALAVGGPSMERLVDLARILISIPHFTEALDVAKQAIVLGFSESESQWTLAKKQHMMSEVWELCSRAYFSMGRPLEALDSIDRALVFEPTSIYALEVKGVLLLALKQPDEALVIIEQALTLEPKNLNLLEGKIVALLDLKQPKQALMTFETAQACGDLPSRMWYNRSIAFYRCKQYKEALRALEHVDPLNAKALTQIGNTLRALHRNKEALRRYNQAIELNHHDPQAWIGKCACDLRAGHLREAWKAFRQALSLLLAEAENERDAEKE